MRTVSSTEKLAAKPTGWEATTVEELFSVIGGGTPATDKKGYWEGDVPWISSADIQADNFIRIRKFVSREGINDSAASIVPKNSIIVVTRVGLGKVGISLTEISFSQDCQGLVPYNENAISTTFFKIALTFLAQEFQSESRGTTVSGITKKQLKELGLPLPPLAEQHRIVAKIEELFSDLDAGIASLKKAKEQLKTFRKAILQLLYDGIDPDTGLVSKDEPISINDIIVEIGQGWSPQCEYDNSEDSSEWAVIKTTAIQEMNFLENENKVLPKKLDPRKHLELKNGDFLITRAGPRNRVGVSCMIRSTRPKLLLCDKAYRLKLKSEIITPEFFELILNSPKALDEINKIKTGISDSGVNLTQSRFLELKIRVPNIETQKRMVSEIESRLSEADNLDKTLDVALTQSESLRQSILKQAFEGKLVPQDPNDEPAEKLLERIRAERAASDEAPKKRLTTEERGRYGGGSPSEMRSVAAGPGTPVEGGVPKPRRGRQQREKVTAAKRRG